MIIAAERFDRIDLDLHHPPDENQRRRQPELLPPRAAPEEGGEGVGVDGRREEEGEEPEDLPSWSS